MLNAAELTGLRDDLLRTLPDTCSVNRATRTYTDAGGWTDTTAVVASVACRIGPLSQREITRAGRLAEEADAVVTLPYDADVRAGDTVTVAGATYDVAGVPIDRSERLVRRVYVRRQA